MNFSSPAKRANGNGSLTNGENTMTNQEHKNNWKAAHIVIGHITMNGLYSMNSDLLNEYCELSNASSVEEVKLRVSNHYMLPNGSSVTGNYINSL